MAPSAKLSKSMSVAQFENGYWYATQIKDFADEIGIPSASKLRKDELEKAIKHFLRTGKIESPTKRNLSKEGSKDSDKGLSLKLPVINYTNNSETKDFIEAEAKKVDPTFKKKSGSRYRLNRWREEQLTQGKKITYGELVRQYVKLCQTEGKFEQVPVGRYINFLSDFMSSESEATREEALAAWHELKRWDAPKNYSSWKKLKKKRF